MSADLSEVRNLNTHITQTSFCLSGIAYVKLHISTSPPFNFKRKDILGVVKLKYICTHASMELIQ